MFSSLRIAFVLTSLGVASLAGPALAQSAGQTVEEMTENFKKQKTRGLAIATPSNTQNSTATANTTETAVNLPEIPKEEQVNINISFDFDSAALRADQRPKLTALCQALVGADVQRVRILGHTDSSGSAEYNLRLSRLRAEEVKRFLASDCGFPVDRMEAVGVGEQQLFDPGNPRGDINRRVEFQAMS